MGLKGWIPKYIPDKLFLVFYSLLSGRLQDAEADEHLKSNKAVWKSKREFYSEAGFLEYQSRMQEICYGRQSIFLSRHLLGGKALNGSVNACEVIACYNAFVALFGEKIPMDFPELLKCFEQKGIALKGYFGTAPNALWHFFQKKGFCVERLVGKTVKDTALQEMAEKYDTFILTVYEDVRDISAMVHTVNISMEKGRYRVHNAGLQSHSFATLKEAIHATHRGNGRAICILGIRKTSR